jgi:hypothetical protein
MPEVSWPRLLERLKAPRNCPSKAALNSIVISMAKVLEGTRIEVNTGCRVSRNRPQQVVKAVSHGAFGRGESRFSNNLRRQRLLARRDEVLLCNANASAVSRAMFGECVRDRRHRGWRGRL